MRFTLRCLAGAAILAAIISRATAAEPIFTEKVFGPETPTGKYKHPACITELSGGDLYLAYYGGAGEYARSTAVYGARLAKGAATWSKPEPIASNPFQSMGNPVLWEAPDETV